MSTAEDVIDFLADRVLEAEVRATLREQHTDDCANVPDPGGYSYPCDCGVPESRAREAAALRRIIANARLALAATKAAPHREQVSSLDYPVAAYWRGQDWVVRVLAEVHADHPDYRPEFRPVG